MIRVALIGVSGYGRVYLDAVRAMSASGRIKLVAVCIVHRKKHQELWDELARDGVRCFEESSTMWQEMTGGIDLTILPTPQHTHCSYTVEAFAAGSHVLVEKPIATSVEDAEKMNAAALKAGRRLFVGFQDLFIENNWILKRELSRGGFGEVSSISFLGLWPRPVSYYSRNSWAGKNWLNGHLVNDTPVSNAFAHFLNLCLFFAGSEESTSAKGVGIEAELLRANEIETFDTASLRIKTDTGIPIHFYCSHACKENAQATIRIVSESATINWKHETGIFIERGGRKEFRKLPAGIVDTRTPMITNIVNALEGMQSAICTPEIAIAPLAINELLQGTPVTPVSRTCLKRIAMPEDSLVAVEGIEETFHACFNASLLPAEYEKRDLLTGNQLQHNYTQCKPSPQSQAKHSL